jgi:hypothetical protein
MDWRLMPKVNQISISGFNLGNGQNGSALFDPDVFVVKEVEDDDVIVKDQLILSPLVKGFVTVMNVSSGHGHGERLDPVETTKSASRQKYASSFVNESKLLSCFTL